MVKSIVMTSVIVALILLLVSVGGDMALAQQVGRGGINTVRVVNSDFGPVDYWFAAATRFIAIIPLGVLIWSMFKFKFNDLHSITWFVLAWAALLYAVR